MGFFSSLFGDKQTTETNQSGTSQSGLTPQILDYWKSISGQFNPSSWQNQGPNPYQTAAAQAQAGYASQLNPAFSGAMGIGASGLDPASIAKYQNPYTQQVVDATRNDFAVNNARENAANQGQAAKLGALGGTNAMVARSLSSESQRRQQDPIIANLRSQGFNTAAGLAKDDIQSRLAGFSQAGNLAGIQSGINQGQFGMGSTLWNQGWQNALMPYQISQQGAGILSGLAPGSGSSQTGTSTGTSTATPSPFSIGANLFGIGASLFSDERLKENIKEVGTTHDGQPIYKFNYKGSPTTEIGLIAQDVANHKPEAVGSVSGLKTVDYDVATKDAERSRKMADGGSVGGSPSDTHERFAKAFDTISGLIARSKGGSVMKPYAGGGEVGAWDTTVTSAGGSGLNWGAAAKKFGEMGRPASGPSGPGASALRDQQASLTQFMSGLRPRYDAGGTVDWGERGPVFEDTGGGSGLSAPSFLGTAPDSVTRSALPPPRTMAYPASDDDLISAVKGFEGFKPRAFSDYKQTSVGYGTRARAPGEVITQEEADRRLREELASARARVDKFAPNLDPGTKAALTSLTFNAGDDWQRSGLGQAIQSGDMGEARRRFLQYTKAGGEDLPGLISRREKEAAWGFGGGPGQADMDSPEGGRLAASASDRPRMETAVASGGASMPPTTRREAPAEDSWLSRMLPGLKEGVWAGKEATPPQRFGTALMSVKGPRFGGPLNGFAENVMAWDAARRADRQIEQQAGALLGELGGRPTIAARNLALEEAKNPEEIKRIQAQTKLAELNSDKAYLAEVEAQKLRQAKEIARADLEERAKLLERIMPGQQPAPDSSAGSNTRYQWRPTPDPQAPMPAAAQPVPQQPAPSVAPQQVAPPAQSPPAPDTPAGRSAIRRTEAGERLRSLDQSRKVDAKAVQTAFEGDAVKMSPMDFVQKYGNRRQDLTVDQIRRLDSMIDRLSRGTP